MAQEVGALYYDLNIKDDGLKTQLAAAQSQMKTFGNNIGTHMQGLSSAFGSIADKMAAVAVKAALIGGVIGAVFVKSAADLQQTSKSFEVLTGNVDTANKLFGQLATYANRTPFEFPQIAKAGQTLLGFGIQSDKVYDNITMLGDIAAATGADFESLALVFGQVNATGKLMGQDSLQLINNRIPITSILAKKLGVSVQEVRARMEDGKISTDLFNQALLETTQAGGFAFKGTTELAKTFNGRMSTLKDTVLEFGRNLLGVKVDPKLGLVVEKGGIFDKLSDMIPKIIDSLAQLTPKIVGAFAFIVKNGDTVKAVLIGLAAAFIGAKVAAIALNVAAMANPYMWIAVAVVALIGALAFLQVKFDWIGKLLKAMKPIIDPIVEAFKYLGRMVMTELAPALAQLWQQLSPLLIPALKVIGALIGGVVLGSIVFLIGTLIILTKAFTWVVEAVTWLVKSTKGAWGMFMADVTTVYNFMAGIFMAMGQVIGGAFKFISDVAMAGWAIVKPIFDAMSFVIRAVYTVVSTILSAIFTITWTVLSTIFQIWLTIWQGIFNFVVGTILTPLYNFFAGIFQGIYNVVAGIVRAIYNTTASVFQGIYNFVAGIVRGIYNVVAGTMNATSGAVTSPINNALNWVRGAAGAFVGAGANIINGLVQGVRNGAGAVVATIQNICSQALSAVKRFFGIRSPSTVFAGIGENLGLGLVNGIDGMAGAVEKSMTNLGAPVNGMQVTANMATAPLAAMGSASFQGSAAAASQVQPGNQQTININAVNIDNEQTADYFFKKLSRGQELTAKGLATQAGSLG